MFGRFTPRVQNRRDPGFATLVQAAIDASPRAAAEAFVVTPSSSNLPTDANGRRSTSDAPADRSSREATALVQSERDWPPLRIAEIPDPPSVEPPDIAPLSKYAAAFEQMLAAHDAGDWHDQYADCSADKVDDLDPPDEDPVLVIDDDVPPLSAQPPVRREEYRHLFSRLRSG
jgi:hypothetical protein